MASNRNVGKLVAKFKSLDKKLVDEACQIFDNNENYGLLEEIYTYCQDTKAKEPASKMKRQQLLIRAIENDNMAAIAIMMKAPYSPELTDLLFKSSFFKNDVYINTEESAPLFFALALGRFKIARYFLEHFKNSIDEQFNPDLAQYYVTKMTQADPLYVARKYLKKKNITSEQQQACQLFIDEFFSLLPELFFEENPTIFRLWTSVDFYTFMLDQAPNELIKSLERGALPESVLRPAAFNLLRLSINRKLYQLFDLLLAALPEYLSFEHTKDENGDTLLHHAVNCEDAYFVFKLLESGANIMLNMQNNQHETPLMIALTAQNLKNYLLCKLYRDGYRFYSLFREFLTNEVSRLTDLPDILSLFRPSKIQGVKAALTQMDTPDKFLSHFFRLADLSDVDLNLEGVNLARCMIEKICAVNFAYMNGDKLVSTNIGNILGQSRINPFSTSMSFQYLNDAINTQLRK